MKPLTGAEKDTLVALVEQGPLWDGDVPSQGEPHDAPRDQERFAGRMKHNVIWTNPPQGEKLA